MALFLAPEKGGRCLVDRQLCAGVSEVCFQDGVLIGSGVRMKKNFPWPLHRTGTCATPCASTPYASTPARACVGIRPSSATNAQER